MQNNYEIWDNAHETRDNLPIAATNHKKIQLSLEWPKVLVVSDFQGHPRWMIFISSERACAIFY